ncbi:MAG: twin-arginine translocase subunit TatC [Bacteroidales bacterium]|jgi:sec-independent protein translocase protein TatC|nr:twin-arginine translocase subunit TatC [Bacteroidales bacterium]
MSEELLTFWEHLDALRSVLFKTVIVVVVVMIVVFCFKTTMFNILLAPCHADFITYRLLDALAAKFHFLSFSTGDETVLTSTSLVSTELTSQFLIHMKISAYSALMVASPYVGYQLFRFISPALYASERKYVRWVLVASFFFFFMGVLLSYFVIFPFSFRFLSNYQVDHTVTNLFTLNSYMGTLVMLTMLMGVMFEIPVIAWLLALLGLLKAAPLRKYRRHAIVAILIIAAIITPTTDIFTLLLVSLPILLLYELSILIVSRVCNRKKQAEA